MLFFIMTFHLSFCENANTTTITQEKIQQNDLIKCSGPPERTRTKPAQPSHFPQCWMFTVPIYSTWTKGYHNICDTAH